MDRVKRGGSVCAAKGCKHKGYLSHESFFSFPKDPVRARIWAVACGREDLLTKLGSLHNSNRLCGGHFEPNCFLNDLRNRLQPQAVPTVFPSIEETSIVKEHNYSVFIPNMLATSSQTEIEMEPGFIGNVKDRSEQWQWMKMQAKRNVRNYMKYTNATGGGPPASKPTDVVRIIRGWYHTILSRTRQNLRKKSSIRGSHIF